MINNRMTYSIQSKQFYGMQSISSLTLQAHLFIIEFYKLLVFIQKYQKKIQTITTNDSFLQIMSKCTFYFAVSSIGYFLFTVI